MGIFRNDGVWSCAGRLSPIASWGRSQLNSCLHASKRCCCSCGVLSGGIAVSALNVRCIRSWIPFCSGHPGSLGQYRARAAGVRSHIAELKHSALLPATQAGVSLCPLWPKSGRNGPNHTNGPRIPESAPVQHNCGKRGTGSLSRTPAWESIPARSAPAVAITVPISKSL